MEKYKKRYNIIDRYILKLSFNNKYFYIETQVKIFNILNKKKHIRRFDLQN